MARNHTETVEVRGHIFDSGAFARVLGDVVEYGGDYHIQLLHPGRGRADESVARVVIGADDPERLTRILMRLQTHGVNKVEPGEAEANTCGRRMRASNTPDP